MSSGLPANMGQQKPESPHHKMVAALLLTVIQPRERANFTVQAPNWICCSTYLYKVALQGLVIWHPLGIKHGKTSQWFYTDWINKIATLTLIDWSMLHEFMTCVGVLQ